MRNTLLDYLAADKGAEAASRAKKHYDTADCMTDRLAGLMTLASIGKGGGGHIGIIAFNCCNLP